MNIVELLAQYRFESSDDVAPFGTSDLTVVSLFNDAQDEACRRKVLLFDATTAAVCQIAVTSATATYALHGAVVAVLGAKLTDADGNVIYLENRSRDELDRVYSGWRENITDDPAYIVVDETSVQIVPAPLAAYTLDMEVQRTPLTVMALPADPVPEPPPDPMIDLPEIASGHHRFLALWVHHRVLSKPDPDYESPEMAAVYEKRFSDYFGTRQDADQARLRRTDMLVRSNVTL